MALAAARPGGPPAGAGLGLYLDRRLLAIAVLGFAAGIPYLLSSATLSARLERAGVELATIGFFGWVSLAYSLKLLWAPAVDRLPIPGLTRRLGRRRAWMLVAQGLVVVALALLGFADPARSLGLTALLALLLAFASATQDIVVDAYRIEAVETGLLGASAANYVVGYRLALLVSGGGALLIADALDWGATYLVMGAAMAVGIATTLAVAEPKPAVPVGSGASGPAAFFREAVVAPLADFARRPGWLGILVFVALFKLADQMLGPIANPFYLRLGFSLSEIGLVSKVYGLAMTLLGALLGGLMVARLGFFASLFITGVLQGASNLMFAALALAGPSLPMLIAAITVENLSGGLVTAAFLGYLSALCSVAFTATQYALLSSLMNLVPGVLKGASGWLAAEIGWAPFFVATALLALPGLGLLVWLRRGTGALAQEGPGDG
ncbi:MAG: MFS transporter [Proteobacteria bacterium]|nr:MFS transporter [Pseudomonadota bacterium]